MNTAQHINYFGTRREFLLGLAYRILGSVADAEDAVHDTFLKWCEADWKAIENPAGWLTTACTRRCLDLLKSAQRTRVAYVGTWLPEPFHASTGESEDAVELASSLSAAFLLLLERLSPKERAAYLLREIFDLPYPDVATAVGVQEVTCRKLVSRARISLGRPDAHHLPPRERQDELLAAFHEAVATGATTRLSTLLADDIVLSADGGGKVPTIPHPLYGADVLAFITGALHEYWRPYQWRATEINGGRGILLLAHGRITTSVSFAYDERGRAVGIYIVRNPDKLVHLAGRRSQRT